jgi:hypothetical protein
MGARPPQIAVSWLLAQAAQLAVGWGRAARIFGLADLSRADKGATPLAATR